MFLNQKRASFLLISLSFILGCTLTLFVLYSPPKTPGLKLLVIVTSAVKNKIERDAIRDTWARSDGNVRTIFVTSRDNNLKAEKRVHNDILDVNVPDEYRLLSRKLLKAFKTVNSVNFDYLLKCDDDSFVNIPLVVAELERAPKNKFYWGYFDGRAPIHKTGQWKETDFKLCDRYLPYAVGGGYVLSKDLVNYIVRNRDYLSIFTSEDVSVGVWLSPLNITRKHDKRFDTEQQTRGCQNDDLVTHKHSPEAMRKFWSRIVETGKKCDREFFASWKPYEYDWKVMPSKCCIP